MKIELIKPLHIVITSWLLVAIWMIFIFMFSTQDSTQSSELSGEISDTVYIIVDDTFPDADVSQESIAITTRNIAHFALYFVLGFLVLNAILCHKALSLTSSTIALLISTLYSLTDEWHQFYVPGRAFEFKDLFIDLIGSVLGVLILVLFVKLVNRKKVI